MGQGMGQGWLGMWGWDGAEWLKGMGWEDGVGTGWGNGAGTGWGMGQDKYRVREMEQRDGAGDGAGGWCGRMGYGGLGG